MLGNEDYSILVFGLSLDKMQRTRGGLIAIYECPTGRIGSPRIHDLLRG